MPFELTDEQRQKLINRIALRQQGILSDYDNARMQEIQRNNEIGEQIGKGQTLGEALLPAAGAIGAGLIAAPFTAGASLPAAIALAGGSAAVGGGLGELLRQTTTGEKDDGFDLGDVAQEAAISGVLSGGVQGLQGFRAARAAAQGVKAGGTAASGTVDDLIRQGATRQEAISAIGKGTRPSFAGQLEKVATSNLDDATKAKNINTIVKSQPTKALRLQAQQQANPVLQNLTASLDDSSKLASASGSSTSKGIAGKINDAGVRRFFNLKESNVRPITEAGKNPLEIGRNVISKAGLSIDNYDDALGAIDDFGRGGKIGARLSQTGDDLSRAVKGQKVDLDPFYKSMQAKAQKLRSVPGNSKAADKLDELLDETRAIYGGGQIDGQDALKLKRAIDAKFGKAVTQTDDLTATVGDFQKEFGQYIRKGLKLSDETANLLDEQQDLILARNLLTSARDSLGVAAQRGVFQSLSPQGAINAVSRRPAIARTAARFGGEKGINMARGVGSPLLEAIATQFGGRGVQQLVSGGARTEEQIADEIQAEIDNDMAELSGGEVAGAQTGFSNPLADPSLITQLMAQDLQTTGGKSIGDLKTIFEVAQLGSGTGEEPIELTATQQQQANNALSGLSAIDTIRANLGGLKKTAVPGGGLFGGLGDRLLGTGELETAIKEASDVITRLRTGAAINANEERFYRSQLPQAFDSPEVVEQKLGMLNNLFQNFINPNRAMQQIQARTGQAVTGGGSLEDALLSMGGIQ